MCCSAPDDVPGYPQCVEKEELVFCLKTIPERYSVMQAKYKWIIVCLVLVLVIIFLRWAVADLMYGRVYYGKAKDMASLPVEQKVVLGFHSDQAPRFVYAYRGHGQYFWAVVDAERDTVVKWIERVCLESDEYGFHEVLNEREASSFRGLPEEDRSYLALEPEDWQNDIDSWQIDWVSIYYNPATKQVLFYLMHPIPDIDEAGPFLYLERQ